MYAKYARFMACPVLITQHKNRGEKIPHFFDSTRLETYANWSQVRRVRRDVALGQRSHTPHIILCRCYWDLSSFPILPLLLRLQRCDRSGQNKGRNEASPSRYQKRQRKSEWENERETNLAPSARAPQKRQRQRRRRRRRQRLLMKFYYAPKVIIYKFV